MPLENHALVKFASVKFAFVKLTPEKSLPTKLAPVRLARINFAPWLEFPVKLAFLKFAPSKLARSLLLLRLTPSKFPYLKSKVLGLLASKPVKS